MQLPRLLLIFYFVPYTMFLRLLHCFVLPLYPLSFAVNQKAELKNWELFCLDFPPLEYNPTKPPHSTYFIDNCFVLFNVQDGK